MNLIPPRRAKSIASTRFEQGKGARLVIGNLLSSTGGTLEAARELADLTGHDAFAEQIEEARSYILRLATKAEAMVDNQTDWRALSLALAEPVDEAWLVEIQHNPAFQFYFRKRLKQVLPDLASSEISLLLSLLDQVGHFVPKASLQAMIGSRSESEQIIKVYVSRLRSALAQIGINSAVETGKGAYRITVQKAVELIRAVQEQG